MSDQAENENQQTVTPEEVRQSMLAELDASQEAIAELSDEELEEVAGGVGGIAGGFRAIFRSGIFNASNALTKGEGVRGALKAATSEIGQAWKIGKRFG